MKRKYVKGRKQLDKRQQRVIDDLFSSGLDEAGVLAKHGVSRHVFRKWVTEKVFVDEIRFRTEYAQQQSRLIIARYAPLAAAKLVQLTESEKEETARRACLDIISLPYATKADKGASPEELEGGDESSLSPEAASRLLAALAEEGQMSENPIISNEGEVTL